MMVILLFHLRNTAGVRLRSLSKRTKTTVEPQANSTRVEELKARYIRSKKHIKHRKQEEG